MENNHDPYESILSHLGSLIDSVCPTAYAKKRFEYYDSVFDDLATDIAYSNLLGDNPDSSYEALRYADHIFKAFSLNKSTIFRFYPESLIIKKFIKNHPLFMKMVVKVQGNGIMQRVSKDKTQKVFRDALISIHIKDSKIEYVEAIILDSDFINP